MRRRNKWTAAGAVLATIAAILSVAFGGASAARGADAAKMRPIFVASSAGSDAVWNAAERIAAEMKFGDVVGGLRALYGDARGVDRSKPFGFVAATDGDAVVGFAFFPIASLAELDFPGADAWKKNLAMTDEGTFYGADKKVELLEKDGWLFVFDASKKDAIPTTDPTVWLGETGGKAPLTLDVDVAAIPEEFLEASFASLRLKAADSGGALAEASDADAADANLKQFDALLRYYSDVVASLQRVAYSFDVDASTGAAVVDFSLSCKNGSPLQESLDAARDGQTRWGAVAETENAVFAAASAGKFSERDKAFLVEYYRTNFFGNVAKQLENSLDDPETLDAAKEILAAFESSTLAEFESGSFDAAEAFAGGERPLVVFGSKISKSDDFRKGVRLLVDAIQKGLADSKSDLDFAQIVKLDAATVDGFSVSTVDFPLNSISGPNGSAKIPPFFAGKTLAARFGIRDDAVLFVVGLDAPQVDAEFARIAAGTATTTPIPTSSALNVAPLGAFLVAASTDVPSVAPAARKIFARIAEADGARLSFAYSIEGDRADVEYVVSPELVRLIGDVVRIQLQDGGVDSSVELDDVFDEE